MKRTRCKVCGKLKAKRPYFKWFCEHCTRAEMAAPATPLTPPDPVSNADEVKE